jgi:hypothetical protein
MALMYKEESFSDNLISATSNVVSTAAKVVVSPFVYTFEGVKIIATSTSGFLSNLFTSEKQVTTNQLSYQSKQARTEAYLYQTEYQLKLLLKENLSLCAASTSLPSPDDDDNNKKIIAAIISTLLVGGGVCLIVISGGSATPGILLCSQLLMNTGT